MPQPPDPKEHDGLGECAHCGSAITYLQGHWWHVQSGLLRCIASTFATPAEVHADA